MRNQEWDSSFAQLYPLNFSELILRLLGCDAVDGESTLGVVNETEVLTRLFNGDDVHETGWVGRIGTNFAVDFDEALHYDSFGLSCVERILESIREQQA